MNKKVPLFFLETLILIVVPLYQKQIASNIWSGGREVKNLKISQLETILLARGVYKDYVEKWEMVDQVKQTGMVANGNLEEIAASENMQGSSLTPMQFKCETSLIKQLDSKPESVWLVRTLYPKQTLKMEEKGIWHNAASNLALLGMHTGVLKCCKSDKWLCAKWQDHNVGLILVAPNLTSGNHSVRYTTFPKSEATVYKWVDKQLHFVIEDIDLKRFTENWLVNDASKARVIFLTNSTFTPPLLFSVLSARFQGEITFGYLPNFNSSLGNLGIEQFPAYLIILPSGRLHVYGSRLGEHLNYKSVELFFITVLPNFKTIFISTCFVMNFVSALNFFSHAYGLWENISYTIINLVMLMIIQLVIWFFYTCFLLLPLPSVAILRRGVVTATSWITLTNTAGILRQVVLYWYFRYSAFFATFSCIGIGYILILRKFEKEPEQIHSEVPVRQAPVPERQEPVRQTPVHQAPVPVRQAPVPLRQAPIQDFFFETTHERTARSMHLIFNQIIEQLSVDPVQVKYICELPTWTWIAHAPVCPLHQHMSGAQSAKVNEQVENCCCFKESETSICANVTIRTINYVPMQVHDGPPEDFDSSNSKCIICQCNFSYKEIVCTLPCLHTFHRNSIHKWLLDPVNNRQCPACRNRITSL